MRSLLAVVSLFVASAAAATAPTFESTFIDRTLRIDFYHIGSGEDELITLDSLVEQGSWAGSLASLIDPFGLGAYQLTVSDPESGTVLFSRGFDSLFAEYRTTDKASRGVRRTFHESVLIPYPRRPVTVSIASHADSGVLTPIFTASIDPDTADIRREPADSAAEIITILDAGDPHTAVDVAVIGEGYTETDREKFRQDLSRFVDVLFAREPFAAAHRSFSVRGVFRPSQDSGCDEPSRGVFARTVVDASFDAFGSERYLLTENNRALRDLAGQVPYDTLLIMVNHDRYGGGGIYNLYCTFTSDNQWYAYLLVHEFGHSFAALADEYYTSSVAYSEFYPQDVEPAEPNITALLDPTALKWRHLVTPGVPIPTPWEKVAFDEMDLAYQKVREELNREIAAAMRGGAAKERVDTLKARSELLSRQHASKVDGFLAAAARAGEVGAFEGAGYASTGLFRPTLDCIMFSKGDKPFCAVCREAIARMIAFHTAAPPRPAEVAGRQQ